MKASEILDMPVISRRMRPGLARYRIFCLT
jgi:hypothetical protein